MQLMFCAGMCTLERRGMEETKDELRTKFWPTYKVKFPLQ